MLAFLLRSPSKLRSRVSAVNLKSDGFNLNTRPYLALASALQNERVSDAKGWTSSGGFEWSPVLGIGAEGTSNVGVAPSRTGPDPVDLLVTGHANG